MLTKSVAQPKKKQGEGLWLWLRSHDQFPGLLLVNPLPPPFVPPIATTTTTTITKHLETFKPSYFFFFLNRQLFAQKNIYIHIYFFIQLLQNCIGPSFRIQCLLYAGFFPLPSFLPLPPLPPPPSQKHLETFKTSNLFFLNWQPFAEKNVYIFLFLFLFFFLIEFLQNCIGPTIRIG